MMYIGHYCDKVTSDNRLKLSTSHDFDVFPLRKNHLYRSQNSCNFITSHSCAEESGHRGIMDAKLSSIYYNPGSCGGYGGLNRLKEVSGEKSTKLLKDVLQHQPTYTLLKFARKRFLRRKVSAPVKNYLWQMT